MSFSKLATVTASTKRNPAIASGKRGVPVTNLSSISITPLDPVSMDTVQRLSLQSPARLYECFAEGGLDIKAGDFLVVGTATYPVRAVGDWAWPNRGTQTDFTHLVVEEVTP